MPEGKKKLRDCITDEVLRASIEKVWILGISYQNAQQGDNDNSRNHCLRVEENLGRLISDDKKEKGLKQLDLFILSASACLHDIGKVASNDEKGWHSDHGVWSMRIMLAECDKLGLDSGQSILVGYIASVHGSGKMERLKGEPMDLGVTDDKIIELAAIFRLADMLDTTYERVPEIQQVIKFKKDKAPQKWQAREIIKGWLLDDQDNIILQAHPKTSEEIDIAYKLYDLTKEDFAKISPHLRDSGYPHELGELDVGAIFLQQEFEEIANIQRPFPGMGFYTQNDAHTFKGRIKEINKLLPLVSGSPISLLIGESGAGKKSLIHAGLFPRLEQMGWKYVWTRPFDNPIEHIRKMVWESLFQGTLDKDKTLLDILKPIEIF